jgi:hypothetical protein
MLSLIIVCSIKIRSFTNGHRGVSHRARYVIVTKHIVLLEDLSHFFLSLFALLEASSSYEQSSSSLAKPFFLPFLSFALSMLNSEFSFSIFLMSSSTVGVVEVFAIEAFSSTRRVPSSPSGGGGVIPCPRCLTSSLHVIKLSSES